MAKEQEFTFEDSTDAPIELEVVPHRSPGFVTGAPRRAAPAPVVAACPYCARPGWSDHQSTCEHCGAPMRATLEPQPPVAEPSAMAAAPTLGETITDAIASVPFGIWKRLPVYAFLLMMFGNGCRCGGLARHTIGALVFLMVLGVVGVVISLQRRP